MNPNNGPRIQAQDAASWYMAHLDPYTPHSENIRTFLHGPLLALTLNALHHTPLDPAGSEISSERAAKEEEKKSATGDWKDYLYTDSSSPQDPQQHQLQQKGQEAYDMLTRRSRARMEAFLAGCMLSVPTESSAVASTKKGSSSASKGGPTAAASGKTAVVSTEDGPSGSKDDVTKASSNHQEEKKGDVPPPSSIPVKSSAAPGVSLPGPPSAGLSAVRQQGKTLIRNISKTASPTKHPQISKEQLMVRLELYVRSLLRVRTLQEECVVAMEPPKALKARAKYITSSFVATAGCVRSMSPVLTRLLTCLTKELLAVETLAEEIVKVIRRVASEYEHKTSFASLAFLSSPEVSAESHLTPLILKYLRYLQSEWEELLQDCELERMLSCAVDPSLRKFFKTIEFRSIGHLLEVCQQHRSRLHNIELAPTVCAGAENVNSLSHCPIALNQALRDLRREIITVNGHVLPPVTSRKDLIHLLSQTMNSRTLTAFPTSASTSPSNEKEGSSDGSKENKKGASYRRTESCPNMSPSNKTQPQLSSPANGKYKSPLTVSKKPNEGEIVITSSEYESDPQNGLTPNSETSRKAKNRQSSTRRKPRRSFHLSTIDLLTRRLLIAASRTGKGGDAYFIV
jgi:hypothetical protein